jgi:pimeloyl-ACP methyl ester carboxylesterase
MPAFLLLALFHIRRNIVKIRIPFLLIFIILAACSAPQPPAITEAPVMTEAPTATEIPPTATEAQPSRPLSNLSADLQRVEFQTEDGKTLVGYYYPSKYANAPVMILMHWAGGDLCDWKDIAPWMQNRADESPARLERCEAKSRPAPMWDPTWFPKMNPEASIAVFVFDFRGFGESKGPGGWNKLPTDALAAFETVAKLEGVDPQRMAALGASIGADGAADGCLLYNQKAGGGCVGAFSLSPGNYLGISYAETVKSLAPVPAHCLAAESDYESAPTCKGASGDNYSSQIYAGSDHGMALIRPDLDPQPMVLIQDFMELVFKESVK